MAGPTIVGSLIIPLTNPSWGFDGGKHFAYVIVAGFLIALPVSYVIAGIIVKGIETPAGK
ncbi:MAG: hypothetical protein APF80_05940 [Alphaproteobacteria bacterium BRH_c36]|nr:MAG: hypothetical protein APF80_05940 [Alphaproteobacteria bacterium BRH_c36]